jgi:hypothetical protein
MVFREDAALQAGACSRLTSSVSWPDGARSGFELIDFLWP